MKSSTQKTAGTLQPLPISSQKWESISLALITSLLVSKEKNDAVLMVVGRLTKMAHFLPTQTTISVADLAQLFFKEIWRLHGMPSSLILDRDIRFTSRFWKEPISLSGTHLNMSLA